MTVNAKDFAGFPRETITFLKDLGANNNRDWFAANRQTYERAIKLPAADFCAAMTVALEALTGSPHKSKIFRIHRDLRFSRDKTPYNTHLHISFVPGSGMASPPCWFFGLDTEALTLGTGIFAFDKAMIEAFRKRVDGGDGAAIAERLHALESRGVRLGEPELKRVPAGYPQDHPRGDLLRRKGLSAWVDFADTSPATDPGLVKTCRSTFERLKPVFDLLME